MGIYASIAKNDPALAALLRETAAATVNRKPGIDCSLVHDGLQFATHGDRCRYVGTSSAEKAHWLEQNKGRYQPIEDVQQEPQLGSIGADDDVGGRRRSEVRGRRLIAGLLRAAAGGRNACLHE